MTEIEASSGWGQLARVRYVENERCVYIEMPNGSIGWVESPRPVNYEPGQVILILGDKIEVAPEGLWKSDTWVAVVRIKKDDCTVVEFGGSTRIVPPGGVPHAVGNTVEVSADGVLRVLDEKPIRFLDLPELDDGMISNFIDRRDRELQSFDDFGGLESVITRARELIELPLKHHDLLERIGARRVKGVLFTGEPGTGKTMLARIIAQESQATFYQINGPEVVSKWFGQSEELLRKIFAHAKRQESAIIFFDEIDSIAGQRDDEAHEASNRLVAQLLTLMDGFNADSNVVVIATTNRPHDIDVALRRPGRFDWEIHFPLPGRGDREQILAVSARRLRTVDPLPHAFVAARTDGWSAAALAGIWTEAAFLAAADRRDSIMAEDYIGGFERVEEWQRQKAIKSVGIA
ncbi:ATP-binding protein [Micromonospora sp. NPDC049102]|uniref:ATP-binding protein n=1 Tax=Micromonospora sp. NPDC049102 TaxID=3364265 RepID=UPI0037175FFE